MASDNRDHIEKLFPERWSKMFDAASKGKNGDSSSDISHDGVQKNSVGDDVNSETGLPEVDWDTYNRSKPRF